MSKTKLATIFATMALVGCSRSSDEYRYPDLPSNKFITAANLDDCKKQLGQSPELFGAGKLICKADEGGYWVFVDKEAGRGPEVDMEATRRVNGESDKAALSFLNSVVPKQ